MLITLNTEKNGIELRFDTKPNTDIITAIQEAGFRWSGKQKIWYAKQNDETVALANQISESEGSFEYKPKTETNIDLWSLTRTEGIEDNYGKNRITNTKEIAANIRKHLRNRFSMCKWSVTSDYNSICVRLLESPFSRDSEVLKAIVNYAYTYAQSWNYDNSDSMTDYFDVNFYGVYKNDIVNYNYNQRECKPNETEIETDFLAKKSEFDAEQKKQEEERIKKGVEEYIIRQAEYEKAEAERQKKIHRIEKNAEIKTVNYTIVNAILKANKDDNLDHTEIYDEKQCKETCQVSREVHFTTEVYALFEKQLMSDYSFFDGMGGSRTDDRRIQSSIDYDMMTEEERETVEWYNIDCVAIYCDGELKLIVDPQGYNYARYVYVYDEQSQKVDTYHSDYGISEEEHQHNIELAETIEDVRVEKHSIHQDEMYLDGKYLVNHTIGAYLDCDKYKARCNNNDWILHPLPLLTAVGNGLGGGDYYGINKDQVGAWAKLIGGDDTDLAGGDCAKIVGGNGVTLAGGYDAIIVGDNGSVAKGKKGSIIVLVERNDNMNIVNFKAVQVDGEEIKEDVLYKLENGEFVEVE